MRFKTVCVLSIAVLLLCVSPSLGKKPPKDPPPEPNMVVAGFECGVDSQNSQHVCTEGPLNAFDRVGLLDFHASYESAGQIVVHSNLGDPEGFMVRNDPDNICGVLGQSFAGLVPETKFSFWGNSNTYEAAVNWKFFDLELAHPDLGPVLLPKVSFFYRDENFENFNEPGDPFEGMTTTIENWAVLARVEGYIPDGAKRGKTIQCGYTGTEQNPVAPVFTVIDVPD